MKYHTQAYCCKAFPASYVQFIEFFLNIFEGVLLCINQLDSERLES
jgi:hypothetical protein